MNPTKEQYAAVHVHDKNLIVVAGAGSGKTRILVERYLQLLESNPDWSISALVAITFTREAAFEMRHRLRLELERRAQGPDAERWLSHLARMDSARIDTIHGLCADILRANAAETGIDPEFEVLDETEAAIILDEVVSDVLGDIKPPSSMLFAHYDAFKIEAALKQMSLVNADYPPPAADPEAIFAGWIRQWEEELSAERQRLIASAEVNALRAIEYLPAGDKLSDLVAQYREYLRQIAADGLNGAGVFRLLRACHDKGAVGNIGSAKAWGGKEAKNEVAQLLRALRQRVKDTLKTVGEMPGELDQLTADLLPLWHQLLEQARQAYRERKRAGAQLDFDDLERLTALLLRDKDIRDRYRNAEFKHLLVDEFQDTNAAQWQIIRSLADIEAGGTLFVVGDPKQSIYQFRGADVSVFNGVRKLFSQRAAGLELPLSISFRSHRILVSQFNALFESLLARDDSSPVADYQVTYGEPMKAFRADSPEYPAIELQLLDNEMRDELGKLIKTERGRQQRYLAEDMRRWEAYEISQRVKTIVAQKRKVFDKNKRKWRCIEFGDIAILFQSMSNVTIYEDVFKAQGLRFLTIAGRGYYDRQEVWDMLDLLRFLHNPADDLALATILRSPIFAFSDDLLFALRLIPAGDGATRPLPLWRALQSAAENPLPGLVDADAPLVEHALDTLSDLRRISGRVTISELLRRALEKTNYLAILTGLPDGARRRSNIEKLLHLAEASGKITLGKFSQYLMDLTEREVREGEAHLEAGNAIRLMTVHASKGLEFPLVALADASWERGFQSPPTLLVDPDNGLSCRVFDAESNKYVSGFAHRRCARLQSLKEAAERKRLLYVAATRAQDYLLVSGQASLNKAGRWTSKGWLQQLLTALGLDAIEREPEQTYIFAGEAISVLLPPMPPPLDGLYQSANIGADLWDFEAEESEYPPYMPPLIKSVAARDSPRPSHITASQIADLGEYRKGFSQRQRQSAAQRFRQSAMRDFPYETSILHPERQVDIRVITGEIVHELLRHGSGALEEPTADALISAIAWERGLTDQVALRLVPREAKELLAIHMSSDVYRWVASARAESRPLYNRTAVYVPHRKTSDSRHHGRCLATTQRRVDNY